MPGKIKFIVALVICASAGVMLIGALYLKESSSDGGRLTTDTRSSTFSDNRSKIAFLKKYLKMPSAIEEAEFHVVYQDNSGGLVPGPSDWDIQVVLRVKLENVPLWTNGMTRVDLADLSWGYSLLPSAEQWAVKSKPVIYEQGRTVVAVFEPEGTIFKRVQKF